VLSNLCSIGARLARGLVVLCVLRHEGSYSLGALGCELLGLIYIGLVK
jgi:hypothetical protein